MAGLVCFLVVEAEKLFIRSSGSLRSVVATVEREREAVSLTHILVEWELEELDGNTSRKTRANRLRFCVDWPIAVTRDAEVIGVRGLRAFEIKRRSIHLGRLSGARQDTPQLVRRTHGRLQRQCLCGRGDGLPVLDHERLQAFRIRAGLSVDWRRAGP